MHGLSNKLRVLALLFIGLSIGSNVVAGLPLSALSQLDGREPSLAPMLESVTPAVVNISTRGRITVEDSPLLRDPFFRHFFDVPRRPRERVTQSLGSGVVVDAKRGYILTNSHVIDKADEITVTLRDERKLSAKLIGADRETDVAVIQVDAKNLSQLQFADSDKLRVGDFAIAIGNPFGLGQTVTSGIVSALGRSGLGIEGYEDFIQTDASINPGNSGGALVNLRGELIGINTAIISPGGSNGGNVGIGFAIPINMAEEVMLQLIEFGEVKRGRLGVYVQDLTPELAAAFGMAQREGAVISQIVEDSPAHKAGLKSGDIIIGVNGKPVDNSADLRNYIGLLRAGQKISMKVVHNGKKKTVTALITAQETMKMAGEKISSVFSGAVLALAEHVGSLVEGSAGVYVHSVERGSPAWEAGLKKDDFIVSVNRIKVRNFHEFKKALVRSRKGTLINLIRGETALFILIQ